MKRLPTPWFDDVGKNNIKPQEKGAEMGSLLRTAKKHKKSRRLGKPEVMAREEYGELEVDVKIEMIRSLIPLGLMHVHELLDDEVKELAGERYARKGKLGAWPPPRNQPWHGRACRPAGTDPCATGSEPKRE